MKKIFWVIVVGIMLAAFASMHTNGELITMLDDSVTDLMQTMTLEEKVGQIFLARCPEEEPASEAAGYCLGGYVLFDRDFNGRTPDSLTALLREWKDTVRIPMLFAVDEEGGTVCRVSNHRSFRVQAFPSPRSLFENGGMEAVLNAESEKASLLASLGIHVNLAPVCDITNQKNAFMNARSLGQSPEVTGEFVSGAILRMAEQNVSAVMKHFPGYGNNTDTHTGIAVDNRSLAELESRDLQPFYAGIENGGQAILVSHTIVTALDPMFPASLSPEMHRYLRLAMAFDGVIITDDLVMSAITERYGAGEAAVLAVLAGNDMLISTDYACQYQAVLTACQEGRIPMEILDSAVRHVLEWKQSMHIL